MQNDLIIIGAGPAGLSAAIQAASYGAKVTVVDETPYPGGKLLGQLYEEPKKGMWIGGEIAKKLYSQAVDLGVTFLFEREVWSIFPTWKVSLNNHQDLRAPNVLLATGAAERPIPIPGWTIPGVMAVGAAQVLCNLQRVRPGKRVLIVGVDILSLTIARELQWAGVDVVGMVLPPPSPFSGQKADPRFHLAALSNMSHLAPSPILRMAGNLAKAVPVNQAARFYPRKGVKIWDIPLMLRKAAIEIQGRDEVERVILADVTVEGEILNHQTQSIEVDCVCISGGLYPLAELAALAGCPFVNLPELGGQIPLHSAQLETLLPGLYVAGNITGIEGAKVAMAQGELAALSIIGRLQNNLEKMAPLIEEAMQKVKRVREEASISFHPEIVLGRRKMQALWEETLTSQSAQ